MYYSHHPRHYLSVDCIIFGLIDNCLSLLLIKRRFDPGEGCWSLMGGFVQEGESLDDAAQRVLADLTGLDSVYMEQVAAFGRVDRDPGERVVSVAYYALVGPGEYSQERLDEHNAYWVPVSQAPELLFDHREMVDLALARLRDKVCTKPVGFNLLPELFTLTQLQMLYEAILGEKIDKRNFRKRVAEIGCIQKTEFIDKNHSRRGAALYQFDEAVYKESPKFKV